MRRPLLCRLTRGCRTPATPRHGWRAAHETTSSGASPSISSTAEDPPGAREPPRELMNGSLPSAVEQRWQEVLRRAAIALKGAGVGVWEADPGGRLHLLATSDAEGFAPVV